jgi:predicted peptidase
MTTEPVIHTEPPSIDIPSGAHQLRFTSDETGDYLDYYLFIPEDAVAGMPLLVFLHGDGQVDNLEVLENYGAIESLRELYGEDYPCIVLSPCTRQASWTKGTIPGTLMATIDYVVAECAIDPNHVMITGHSRGAMGVWFLISEYGDYFSAAVPVSCGTDCILNYENVSKVPVYAMAGNVGRYENIYLHEMELIVGQIQAANGIAVIEYLEDCGHADTDTAAYTEEVIQWMLEQ